MAWHLSVGRPWSLAGGLGRPGQVGPALVTGALRGRREHSHVSPEGEVHPRTEPGDCWAESRGRHFERAVMTDRQTGGGSSPARVSFGTFSVSPGARSPQNKHLAVKSNFSQASRECAGGLAPTSPSAPRVTAETPGSSPCPQAALSTPPPGVLTEDPGLPWEPRQPAPSALVDGFCFASECHVVHTRFKR